MLVGTWMKTATLRVAAAGSKSTRMYPLDPDVLPESNNEEMSRTPNQVAFT